MPLARYKAGAIFEAEDGSVSFGMHDPGSALIIPCQVSVQAISALCGDDGERNRLEDFESVRDKVEAVASALFDLRGEPVSVFVSAEDCLA